MTSPLLTKYALPAETQRGCIFSEDFPDVASVNQNGGVLYNNPICSQKEGINLVSASSQYVSYADRGYSFGDGTNDYPFSVSALVYMRDATNFAIAAKGGAGTYEWRLLTIGTDSLYLATYNNAGACIGRYYSTALTTYENRIIHLAGTYSGSKTAAGFKLYLNGNRIDNADFSAGGVYTAMSRLGEPVVIGRQPGSVSYTNGKIRNLKIWNVELTAQECLDLAQNSTYTYDRKSLISLPMGIGNHDPTNVQTLDVSGKGLHAKFGDGVTPTTYPTKLASQHGMSFDGGDYLKTASTSCLSGLSKCSFCAVVNLNSSIGEYAVIVGCGSVVRKTCRLQLGGAGVGTKKDIIFETDPVGAGSDSYGYTTSAPLNYGNINTIIGVFDGTGTGNAGRCKIYVNGKEITGLAFSVTAIPTVTPIETSNIYVGRQSYSATLYWVGDIYSADIFSCAMSPTQVLDWHFRQMKALNRV